MPSARNDAPCLMPGASEPRPRWLWLAWFVSLPLLVLFAGSPSCARTQEARVLETAWEMTERGQSWLLPVSNGILRLQKPPIPYWMAAAGFTLGGVNEWAGRLPTVLVTWLMLGLAALAACRLFNTRVGLLTLGLLLTTYETFRFGRLAETDAPAALSVTLAIWAFWRASEGGTLRQRIAWNWLAGAGLGLAMMTKGGPALFPILFLLGWSAANRTWRYIVEFLRTGGWVAFLAIGLPWYLYLYFTKGLQVIWLELHVVTQGEDHGLPFYAAAYLLLQATAPWCGIVIAALIEAARQCPQCMAAFSCIRHKVQQGLRILRKPDEQAVHDPLAASPQPQAAPVAALPYARVQSAATTEDAAHLAGMQDRRLMLMWIWVLSILVPLTLIGNKQIHYFLPLMPPVMILCAWITDAAFRESSPARVRKVGPILLIVTICLGFLAGPGLLLGASKTLGALHRADWLLGGGTVAGTLVTLLVARRYGLLKALPVYCFVLALLLANVFGPWGTRLSGGEVRDVGLELVSRHGAGPYYFWGNAPDLSMVLAMRTLCVGGTEEQPLRDWLRANPTGVVLMAANADRAIKAGKTNSLPPFLAEMETIGQGRNRVKVFTLK